MGITLNHISPTIFELISTPPYLANMSAAQAPVATGQSADRPPRHRRGPRRGNRNTGNDEGRQTAQNSTPVLATSTAPSPNGDNTAGNERGGHGRRGGFARGGRRGATRPPALAPRAFGGHLTSTANSSPPTTLAADAPVFVPGKPVVTSSRPSEPPRQRRKPKSQAPDIVTRTHEDISNAHYECVICTNEILANSKIWSCDMCWSVLHLSCVKKWSQNEVSTLRQRAVENGELPPPRQWRCPGCNLPKEDLPTVYTCWCAKEIEPRSLPGLPPHSCGQTCSKPRPGKCPHPCDLICHAGPCPPCSHMGPSISCYCGKEATARRCVDTNYDAGWSCGQICGDLLPCGDHTCEQSCHEEVCGSCEIMIDSRCYCGKVEKPLPCAERDEVSESEMLSSGEALGEAKTDTWIGSFDCGGVCQRSFDCGKANHNCEKGCHTQDLLPAHCPYSPDVVTHCPCGKTPLETLLPTPRTDCTQPIPHCKEKCSKPLECGHTCEATCHECECGPCNQSRSIACRCGRTTSSTLCHQGTESRPQCTRVCKATLNCGRHECGEHCCTGEKKASERQASKRKHRALDAPRISEDNIKAEHICLRVCGRSLKCGNHFCADLCHKGPCRSCLEAIFEEVSCACDRTVLHPPQPCGTKPPQCHHDCTRQRTCGHPQTKHQCHEDTETCPKCPFLVEKRCICGKQTLKNQPCWFTEVRCGMPCGKKLKCGNHTCQKLCHRPSDCEDAKSPCAQPCGRKKTVCDHTCSEPCHAPYPCKEITPCQAKTFITCECQHQKQAAKCLASKTSGGNTEKTLDCNDECLKLQRNAKLAAALNIDPSTHLDDHIPYSKQTIDLYKDNVKFAQIYEREFRVFAADEKEKRLRFKPMQPQQRALLHSLAEDYGLDSESQDPEPHRHVCIFKTPRFVSAPMKTLAQCVTIKAVPVEEPSVSTKERSTGMEPFNAFLLSNPKFGLTIDELYSDLSQELRSSGLDYDIAFLPAGDVVVSAKSTNQWRIKIEPTLSSLRPLIVKKVKSLNLASTVSLCSVDSNMNVMRKEDDHAGGGWSQVAKGATRVKPIQQESFGAKSSFTILGNKGTKKVKKEVSAEAVEDWEKEVEAWDAS